MSEDAIYDRRSIRKYQDREVPTEYIEQLIDAARMAPSAKNRQPWKYIVYTRDGKQKLTDAMAKGIEREESGEAKFPDFRYGIADAKNTVRVMREAPVVIVVLNTNGKSPFIPVKEDGRIVEQCDALSIGASIQNMLLRAQELGLSHDELHSKVEYIVAHGISSRVGVAQKTVILFSRSCFRISPG